MKDTYGSFDELDIKAKVMIAIWELTKDDGSKFASPAEIAKYLKVTAGYVRTVIGEIEQLPRPHLSENKYHAPGKKHGRKRIGYRLDDDAVIKEGTALILLELLKSHRRHFADRREFIELMVEKHGMTRAGVNGRIDEAIRAGYVEDLTSFDGTIRGRERINLFLDYVKALAAKYRPPSVQQRQLQPVRKRKAGKKNLRGRN